MWLGMVVHVCHLGTWEANAGSVMNSKPPSPMYGTQGQTGLHETLCQETARMCIGSLCMAASSQHRVLHAHICSGYTAHLLLLPNNSLLYENIMLFTHSLSVPDILCCFYLLVIMSNVVINNV